MAPESKRKRKRSGRRTEAEAVAAAVPTLGFETASEPTAPERKRVNRKIVFGDGEAARGEGQGEAARGERQAEAVRGEAVRGEGETDGGSVATAGPPGQSGTVSTRAAKTAAIYDSDSSDSDAPANGAADGTADGAASAPGRRRGPAAPDGAALAARAAALLPARASLPIHQHKQQIVSYIAQNQVTIVIGETGSGKSTQIPQYLMGSKMVAVTQPRRVAALSLAARVSEEVGTPLGQLVGYQVRFANRTSRSTRLKYLTDGMLLRELMLDPQLKRYLTVVIDEAHERTILTDLILGFLKLLLQLGARRDLKVVIMSATLNAQLFARFFDAPVLYVEGKMFPVTRHYLGDGGADDVVDTVVRSVVQVNMGEPAGDILCFLPGQDEIDSCVAVLLQIAEHLPREAPLIVAMPLYAALSPLQQQRIFEPLVRGARRQRKVILATNIAETSITVSGVKYVIDTGLRKVKVWRHLLGLSTLLTTPISQALAQQRAGRAGRESAGKVFRLYLEKVFAALPQQQEAEIMRNDIVLPVLTLKRAGVEDLLNWTWLEHPGREAILSALATLYALGALSDAGRVTPLGAKMATLPLPPQLLAVLITAFERAVLRPVVDIAACLLVDNLVMNVATGDGELRDEVNQKRRQHCPRGVQHGDLVALKEYFDTWRDVCRRGGDAAARDWCKELHFSHRGFRNVTKVREQLGEYMRSTIRQDDLAPHERERQLRSLALQLAPEEGVDADLDIPNVLKSFLKGYVTNTAIGMPDRSFRTVTTGQLISIHPSLNLFGRANLDAIMYMEYVYTTKGYGRNCLAIELGWLQETSPQLLGAAKVHIE